MGFVPRRPWLFNVNPNFDFLDCLALYLGTPPTQKPHTVFLDHCD